MCIRPVVTTPIAPPLAEQIARLESRIVYLVLLAGLHNIQVMSPNIGSMSAEDENRSNRTDHSSQDDASPPQELNEDPVQPDELLDDDDQSWN